ncbi:MAG: type II restriction endonuclease [Candidatus Omnitrophica bacterium]|nr:type II restriction endonuclease [Candidatus Omnitrophota bacterium]
MVEAYQKLGFKDLEEYKDYFLNTLLPTNKTYDYFVDWKKVKNNLKKYIKEISLMNILTKVNEKERKEKFIELIKEYPKTIEVIPLLIAERITNSYIDIFDIEKENFVKIDFFNTQLEKEDIEKLTLFLEKTGIFTLFSEINDLYDYLLGIEVGLDTNGRKNRSGKIFENMVKNKLNKLLSDRYIVINNDPNFSLYSRFGNMSINKKIKKHDFVIYKSNTEIPLAILECSFYNTSGSKEISISESYALLSKLAKDLNIIFIWITDGPAWLKMKSQIESAIQQISYVLNYKMLTLINKILL